MKVENYFSYKMYNFFKNRQDQILLSNSAICLINSYPSDLDTVIRVVLKPDLEEIQKYPQLKILNNMVDGDITSCLQGGIGYIKIKIHSYKNRWYNRKKLFAVIDSIQSRSCFFKLSNFRKRRYKHWDDLLLDYVEKTLTRLSIRFIIIVCNSRRTTNISYEKHYVNLPKTHNYIKDGKCEFDIRNQWKDLDGYWIKQLR